MRSLKEQLVKLPEAGIENCEFKFTIETEIAILRDRKIQKGLKELMIQKLGMNLMVCHTIELLRSNARNNRLKIAELFCVKCQRHEIDGDVMEHNFQQ